MRKYVSGWSRAAMLAAGVVFLLGTVKVTDAAGQFPFFEDPLTGEKAPEFTLSTISGGKAGLSQLRGGKPAVIFFWATWCPHCREQLNHLKASAPDFARKGYQLILVDLGEAPAAVKAYMERMGFAVDVLIDSDGAVADKYNVIGLPTYFFIDADGIIQASEHFMPKDYESYFSAATSR